MGERWGSEANWQYWGIDLGGMGSLIALVGFFGELVLQSSKPIKTLKAEHNCTEDQNTEGRTQLYRKPNEKTEIIAKLCAFVGSVHLQQCLFLPHPYMALHLAMK